jgi:hypothetical protein
MGMGMGGGGRRIGEPEVEKLRSVEGWKMNKRSKLVKTRRLVEWQISGGRWRWRNRGADPIGGDVEGRRGRENRDLQKGGGISVLDRQPTKGSTRSR